MLLALSFLVEQTNGFFCSHVRLAMIETVSTLTDSESHDDADSILVQNPMLYDVGPIC